MILQEGWTQTQDPIFHRYQAQAIGLWLQNSSSLDAPRRLSLLEQGLGRREPPPAALPLLDAQRHALAIDVGPAQMHSLADTHSGCPGADQNVGEVWFLISPSGDQAQQAAAPTQAAPPTVKPPAY